MRVFTAMKTRAPWQALLKYDDPIPRYTSYPPSSHFLQDPEKGVALNLLYASNHAGPWNVSYFFHIPFCPKRRLFSGCHTEIGRPDSMIGDYMRTLGKEVNLLLPRIDPTRPVTQIHFGGGAPNAVPFFHLETLLDTLRSHGRFEPDAEVAIECDPNLVTEEKLRELANMGFNRVSFGIQDFDVQVLKAVNLRFPRIEPRELFRICRDLGFAGNNLDLIYGLPHQTQESFRETVYKAIEAAPDRISLFPYAHVPGIDDHQKSLAGLPMPDRATRLAIAWNSRVALERAGYRAIGMDHFALETDELAIAAGNGGLIRNLQGYSPAGRAGQVYAMGASAITQLHSGFLRNTGDLREYRAMISEGRLPWAGVYRMRPEDLAVRGIINGLLCDGKADLERSCAEAGVTPAWKARYLSGCLKRIRPFLEDNLVAYLDGIFTLVGNGSLVASSVAAAFDPMLAEISRNSKEMGYTNAV